MAELQALGVPLERPDVALHVVFPRVAEHLWLYKSDNPPSLDISHMELDDALCHIQIVKNCIHRFSVRRKMISRDLSLLHRRRRAGQSAGNTKAMNRLIQLLYTTRCLLNEHTVLFLRLRRKVKTWSRKRSTAFPTRLCVTACAAASRLQSLWHPS